MRGSPWTIQNFGRGLLASQTALAAGGASAEALLDVEPMGEQGVKRRSGTNTIATLAVVPTNLIFSPATGLFFYINNGATNTVYKSSSGTPLFTETGWQTLAVSDGPTQSTAYMTAFSATTPRYYDGSLHNWVATTGTVPLASILTYHESRLFAAGSMFGVTTARVQASAPGDALNWGTATGQGFTVDFDIPSRVTALASCGPYLIVFGRHKTYAMYDTDTGANRCISNTHGVPYANGETGTPSFGSGGASSHAAIGVDGEAYFISHDGVYVTNGDTVRRISGALPSSVFTPATGTGMDLAVWGRYLAFQAGAAMYLYDIEAGSWWQHSLAGGGMCSIPTNTQSVAAGIAVSTSTTLHRWNPDHTAATSVNTLDRGSATVTGSWTSGQMNFSYSYRNRTYGNAGHHKRLRGIDLEGSGAVDLSVYADDPSYGSPATRSLTLPARAYNFGTAKAFAWKLSGTGLWRADSLTLGYQYRQN